MKEVSRLLFSSAIGLCLVSSSPSEQPVLLTMELVHDSEIKREAELTRYSDKTMYLETEVYCVDPLRDLNTPEMEIPFAHRYPYSTSITERALLECLGMNCLHSFCCSSESNSNDSLVEGQDFPLDLSIRNYKSETITCEVLEENGFRSVSIKEDIYLTEEQLEGENEDIEVVDRDQGEENIARLQNRSLVFDYAKDKQKEDSDEERPLLEKASELTPKGDITSMQSEGSCGFISPDSNPIAKPESDPSKTSLSKECTTCGKKFKREGNLKKHLLTHKNVQVYKCKVCKETVSIATSVAGYNKKLRICEGCSRSEDAKKNAKSGGRKKSKECGYCSEMFGSLSNLVEHIKRFHRMEKIIMCGVCCKKFAHKNSLISHMRIHTNERPYSCSECNKSFRESGKLVRHFRIHTGEKPYECVICYQDFNQSGILKIHYKNVHNIIEERVKANKPIQHCTLQK